LINERKKHLVKLFQQQLAGLNLLAFQRDLQVVKTLLWELKKSNWKSGKNQGVEALVVQLETKVASSTKVSEEELMQLKSHFVASNEDALRLVESKLDSLNLLAHRNINPVPRTIHDDIGFKGMLILTTFLFIIISFFYCFFFSHYFFYSLSQFSDVYRIPASLSTLLSDTM
jgi:ATP-dependent Zn protease